MRTGTGTRVVTAVFPALLLAACDSAPLLFPDPVAVELVAVEAAAGAGAGAALSGVVGERLEPGPRFRVLDARGNPVPLAEVSAQVLMGGGTLTTSTLVSNDRGEVEVTGWTLGPRAGSQRVRLSVMSHLGSSLTQSPLPAQISEAVARAGTPVELARVDTSPILGRVGTPTSSSLVVRVADRFDNPVSGVSVKFEVIEGTGSVTMGQAVSNTQGLADPGSWTMGMERGSQALRASVAGAPELRLNLPATVRPPWSVEAVHLNQGNQSLDGQVPLVEGRAGLLRVFLQGAESSPPGVGVRVRIRHGSTVVLDQRVGRAGGGGIRAEPVSPDQAGRSWNLQLDGALVRRGMELQVELDPDGVLGLTPGEEEVWPSAGAWTPLPVVAVPPFRVTFIPIVSTWFGTTGRITEANAGDYMGVSVDAFPIGELDVRVRSTPLIFDGSFENANTGWSRALQDVRDLRVLEGGFDRYYHGILRRPVGGGIAGIAYVVTNPVAVQSLAAVSFDQLPGAGMVIAHEFGHNFGRFHSPCGSAGNPDPAYPYPGGRMATPGYSSADGTLRATTQFFDVMGYCTPFWPSDHTYQRVLEMRMARPVGAPFIGRPAANAGTDSGAEATRRLLVSGGWSASEGLDIRPALETEVPPTRSRPLDPVLIEILDTEGRVVGSARTSTEGVDHADDATLRHFSAVVSFPRDAETSTIRVTTPWGMTTRSREGETAPEIRVERGSTSAEVRLRWDAERWPLLVLREPDATRPGDPGRIVGFLRSGDAVVPLPAEAGGAAAPHLVPPAEAAGDVRPGELRIQGSDGLRTVDLGVVRPR